MASLLNMSSSRLIRKLSEKVLATLTLTDDSVVVINGEGTLTADMVADYISTCKHFVAGDNCTSIGYQAFRNCVSLTSIDISNSVTIISASAFRGCTNLTSVNILNSVTSLDTYAFDYCSNLASSVILNNVVTIGRYAFRRTMIQEVVIGSSVTLIGTAAFYNCSRLAQVTILAVTPPTLQATALAGNKAGRKIYVPSESVEAYKTADGWLTYADDIEAIPST